jgi:hypothetical protein
LPSISWSASQSCCFQIHIQYSFYSSTSFHSLYMPKPTQLKFFLYTLLTAWSGVLLEKLTSLCSYTRNSPHFYGTQKFFYTLYF